MLFEHLIYSTAIAIIAGMIWYRHTGRDPSWIIIASAYAPDFDIFAGELLKKLDLNILINGAPIRHGNFHNIAFLLLFATAAALVLRLAGMKFVDSFLFAGIGFAAHMFEDALVFNPAYAFIWPISGQKFGIGLIDYKPDLYGLANTDVLIVGVISMVLCAGIRAFYEGKGGIRRIVRTVGVASAIMILMVPVFSIIDMGVAEKVTMIREKGYIDKWSFTQNASWDPTVFHSGNHSAKIEIHGNESNISVAWAGKQVSIKPSTSYIFSAWGKTYGVGGNSSPSVRIVESDVNEKRLRQTALEFGKGSNDWTMKQTKFITLNNTSKIVVYANTWNGYGTFWFDDVELHEEGTDNNLIDNSGFEDAVKSYFISRFKN
ncbi:MAG: metal-dependent hydrolase [Candidatus Methanoperedens sp.]|nr:metal-dependent hydrolase [Candidatus Methanoperedens sp.]